MQQVNITSTDGYSLNVHIYEVDSPKGVVQVIHGMEEHQQRYEKLAKALNEIGYIVVTSDMRGHGPSAKQLGYFNDSDGYKLLIEDQKVITSYINKCYKNQEIILFAHSMGTIITRNLIQKDSNKYKKIILSGYPTPVSAVKIAKVIAKIVKLFKGPKYYSKFLENLTLGSYNKKINNPRTPFDWLSNSCENVDNYINDKYCGHGFTVSAFIDLYTLLDNMTKVNNFIDVNTNMPILMISGKEDPCVGFEKGSKKSVAILKEAGFNNIKVIAYEKMRHEILNEENFKLVINDIKNFISE